MSTPFVPDFYASQRDIVDLQVALDAVCPNHGVSIGRWEKRETWRVDFKQHATEAQKKAAAEVVRTFKLQDHNEDMGKARVIR